MAAVNKIDSNITGLRYAEEASLKTLPGSPVWIPLEPNSYKDFGGNLTTMARNPISSDRQRKKGVITDLDAAGGFNTDLTQSNIQELMQGFMFANLRRKAEEAVTAIDLDAGNPDEYEVASTADFLVNHLILGSGFTNSVNNSLQKVTAITSNVSIEIATGSTLVAETAPAGAKVTAVGYEFASATLNVDASGIFPRLTRASGALDFTTLGLIPGEFIFVGGDSAGHLFVNAVNNGFKRVKSVAATYIELDKSAATMINETGTGLTVRLFFGRVLKNEIGTSIVRKTYNLERTLGASDDASPSQIQSEYLTGAVANELVLNVSTADKVNADLSFVACDYETRTGAVGVKSGTRPNLVEQTAFNTSSDFSRIKMASVSSTDEAPTPLFSFVTDMTLTINNGVTPNKAIGTLGAFDVTAGTFAVSGKLTAYFSNVSAIEAVRANSDITLDMAMVKENAGVVIDLPLLSLSDGRANIEQDNPITLPINHDAASGEKYDANMNHTLMFVFFDYLPNAAQ